MGEFASTDRRIAEVAAPQGGYIHQAQLAALSLTAKAIHHRVRRGYLIRAYKLVYAVGHVPSDPISRAKGALLAAGPGSALSHDSAASYYGIFSTWTDPFHVTVPTDRRIAGLRIHRNCRLRQSDILTPEPGLRVISPILAVLDVADRLTPQRLDRVVNEIRLKHRIPLATFVAVLDRFPRRPGVKALRAILQRSQSQPTRSAWEDEWPDFAAKHQLPAYVMNQRVAGYRVDVLFTAERVITELDGWETHQTHAAFIRDREQDATILAGAGMPTVRITYERFHRHAPREAARLRAILDRRRAELARPAG